MNKLDPKKLIVPQITDQFQAIDVLINRNGKLVDCLFVMDSMLRDSEYEIDEHFKKRMQDILKDFQESEAEEIDSEYFLKQIKPKTN